MPYTHEKLFTIQEIGQNPTLTLALQTISIGKQALVFVSSKASAEKVAEIIAKKAPKGDEKQQKIAKIILSALGKPTKQCERLAKCIEHGIAFHHSGLVAQQREAIEDGFRDGSIKIIACTPTLAAGVDLPAFRTILKDLKRYTGTWGMQWIPVLEYQQMCGRAGRPGMEEYGEAIAIASSQSELDEIHSRYVMGQPEDIYSKLAVEPVLRTYLLSLIVSGIVRDMDSIHTFFSKTFWAHQYGDMDKLNLIIRRVLDLLEGYEFIRREGGSIREDDFTSADELGQMSALVVKPTLLGTRVSQLYIDPLTAHYIINCLKRTQVVLTTPFSLLQMICFTLEMRPLLSVKTKEYDLMQEEMNKRYSELLSKEPSLADPNYEEYLASIKTAAFLHEWIDEKDEEYLLEKYAVRPGELHAKRENADWLLHGSEEIAKLLSFQEAASKIANVRFRLEYGVKEELFALLKLRNIGRVRARKLYLNKIKDIGDIKTADMSTLSQILGKALAIDVKRQVGQDVPDDGKEEKQELSKNSLTGWL